MTPPLPTSADEDARLQSLKRYQYLTTPGEDIFQALLGITAKLFAVPIALVSLVEQEAIFLLGNIGLPGLERIARQHGLCAITILQEELTLFENLPQQPCPFVDTSVLRALNLEFYAGHPLRTDTGSAIGTLCLMDRKPRRFIPAEQLLLAVLGSAVMSLLELRLSMEQTPPLAALYWEKVQNRITPVLAHLTLLAELDFKEPAGNAPVAASWFVRLEKATLAAKKLDEEFRFFLAELT